MMRNVSIFVDYDCDLPAEAKERYDINVCEYSIRTGRGEFIIHQEISDRNLHEYMQEKDYKVQFYPPSPKEYAIKFSNSLAKGDTVLFFCSGPAFSEGFSSARKAVEIIEKAGNDTSKLHIINTRNISIGYGMIVTICAEQIEKGIPAENVAAMANQYIQRVRVRFLQVNDISPAVKNEASITEGIKYRLRRVNALRFFSSVIVENGIIAQGKRYRGGQILCCHNMLRNMMKSIDVSHESLYIVGSEFDQEILEECKQYVLRYFDFKKVYLVRPNCANIESLGRKYLGVCIYSED